MSIYTVDVHQIVHTCPASAEAHVVDSRRTVVGHVHGGACRTPIRSPLVDRPLLDCRRVLPAERQCAACKPLIIIRDTTTENLGQQDSCRTEVPQPLGRFIGRYVDADGYTVEVYR